MTIEKRVGSGGHMSFLNILLLFYMFFRTVSPPRIPLETCCVALLSSPPRNQRSMAGDISLTFIFKRDSIRL
ncbi:hypothetical protein ES319_A05G196200v1 [Gossypium barbadense]|uniref:Uncharacterized protein n=1 Tax=Gossypium barbadense TaxID=3634 RepID=A0A5J5VR16_GOSBA|nr:hypothetical protein ES319_A05G196200v1 [Gossypium barbadense]